MTTPEFNYAVIIPVFNHGRQIGRVVEKTLPLGLPVLVVDDGSTDSTPQVLKSFPSVKVIRHKENRGKGAALLSGFTEASKFADWAVTIDGDGQHDPQDIPALIAAIPEGQKVLIIGKRAGMEKENVPWTSLWGRKFSNFWVWASSGSWVSDSQSGFRVYPLPEIMELKSRARRYQFEVEILVLAIRQGLPLIEVPVSVQYPPGLERVSHFKPWMDFWRNTRTFSRLVAARFLISPRYRK
ncbi:MAG TPA: glycosyltransferase family 2 protein [Thermodesulfobacteriota bacterium]|nr:glycosyltransferase family 2 protein [Thermodesulfobacteriota bacterium]